MVNDDEKIIVKQPKVSFFFFRNKFKVFFAREICGISFKLLVFTVPLVPFAENINKWIRNKF